MPLRWCLLPGRVVTAAPRSWATNGYTFHYGALDGMIVSFGHSDSLICTRIASRNFIRLPTAAAARHVERSEQ
jgi:hypothetical protein